MGLGTSTALNQVRNRHITQTKTNQTSRNANGTLIVKHSILLLAICCIPTIAFSDHITTRSDPVSGTQSRAASVEVFKGILCAQQDNASKEKPGNDDSSQLATGQYFVTQSWSQEQEFQRPYFVTVPKSGEQQKLPVFLFLHGNGGNAKAAMRNFTRQRKAIASRYILVFPQGYRESWNIVSERSKANDLEFIETIIRELATFDNVDATDVTIMGNSNGAALVNQILIESKLPNIRNYISGVSPLNVWQHDGNNFKAKGDDNNYKTVAQPAKGKRLLNISGTEDRLVPYHGGPSRVIPAKDGKLAFVDAEESIFRWAKAMGYDGKRLSGPSRVSGKLEVFSYLDSDVIHYKVLGGGHGATGAIDEMTLLKFLENKS